MEYHYHGVGTLHRIIKAGCVIQLLVQINLPWQLEMNRPILHINPAWACGLLLSICHGLLASSGGSISHASSGTPGRICPDPPFQVTFGSGQIGDTNLNELTDQDSPTIQFLFFTTTHELWHIMCSQRVPILCIRYKMKMVLDSH